MPTPSEISRRFDHHPPPSQDVIHQHELVRGEVRRLAHFINRTIPEGREQALALTKLEEVMFHANAGIARFHAIVGPEVPEE